MDFARVSRAGLFAGFASLLVLSACGGESAQNQATPVVVKPATPIRSPSVGTVARIHFAGKNALSARESAAQFMAIWNLPETRRLEAQTLDKLSSAPWRLLRGDASTNTAIGLLRPLLDDLLGEESFLEIRRLSNQASEFSLAIHLNDDRATVWETNLAAVFESLTGIHPQTKSGEQRGWALKKHHPPNCIELQRIGEWTIIGAAQDTNTLMGEMLNRLQVRRMPFDAPLTNDWLEAYVDLQGISDALAANWKLPGNFPGISLTAAIDQQNVLTRGELKFAQPITLDWEPWRIPTNFINKSLSSFTAIRGIRPWLGSLQSWKDLRAGPPPNQLFLWASTTFPTQSYFAAPQLDASNQVHALTERVLERFPTNEYARFDRSRSYNGLIWRGLAYLTPQLQSIETNGDEFVMGGFSSPGSGQTPPSELVDEVLTRTNLIAYEWEATGLRIEQLTFISQFARFVFHRSQLSTNTAAIPWFKALRFKLDKCTTQIVSTGPQQLSFERRSTMGFTAMELHILADWLESPQFPRGFFTELAPRTPSPVLPGARKPPASRSAPPDNK